MESSTLLKYKDCYHYCLENGCNRDMQVAQGFAPGKTENPVESCHACSYVEHDNGDVEGNELCPENLAENEDFQLRL